MRRTSIAAIVLCLLVASMAYAHELRVAPGRFGLTTDRGFDRAVPGPDFALTGRAGEPELPVQHLTYVLPPGMEATAIKMEESVLEPYRKDCHLYPAQPDAPIGCDRPWVGPDSSVYGQSSPYPASPLQIVHTGTLDGASMVTVAYRPLMYIPARREMHLYRRLKFEFLLAQRSGRTERPAVRGQTGQRVYEQMMRAVVQNYEDLDAYYVRPALVPEAAPAGGAGPIPRLEQYTIITTDALAAAYQPFANWLTDKGVPATVVPVSQILHHYPGEPDDAARLKEYIRYGWSTCGTIWVLLGADDRLVPFRKCCASDMTPPLQPYDDKSTPPSDLYFSDLSGIWDYDGDGLYGEPTHDRADLYPEVFVGRVLARTPQEVSNWVNKALAYEQVGSSNLSLLTQCTWVYDSLYARYAALYPNYAPGTTALFPGYFSFHLLNSVGANTAVGYHSIGAGLTVHYAHGACRDFCPTSLPWKLVRAYWPGPRTDLDDGVNNIANSNRYGVVYSIGCYCAAYDSGHFPQGQYPENEPSDTCVADAFTDTYASKGAAAYLGNTRYGYYGGSTYLFKEFCRQLFGAASPFSLAAVQAVSKINLALIPPGEPPWPGERWYVTHAHNLFGTPEFEPWINAPGQLVVQHPSRISVGVPTVFTVTVRAPNLSPLPEVRVCLHKAGDIYAVGWTGANGTVSFLVTAQTSGTLKVTCYKPRPSTGFGVPVYTQYLPRRTTCAVIIDSDGPMAEPSNIPAELVLSAQTVARLDEGIVVRYGLPEAADVRLDLHDVTGRRVATLVNAHQNPGYYSARLHPAEQALAAGTYFAVLASNGELRSAKLVLTE